MNIEDQRNYAWSYFQLHASQRMTTFNFFIVIAALLTTALASTFVQNFDHPGVGVVLGAALAFIAFIFWKLDQRVRFLIKHAETSLKEIEKVLTSAEPEEIGKYAILFLAEETTTSTDRLPGLWRRHLSYSRCFGAVYLLFGLLGVLGSIGTLLR